MELKQWEAAGFSDADDCVTTFLGGAPERQVLHPSRQVGNYQRYLLDTNTAFSDGQVGLRACSYLHNLRPDNAAELLDQRFEELLKQWPLYPGESVDDLVSYLDANVGSGDGGSVLERILEGKFRPHKRLLDHTAKMIKNEPAFVLLDEQQVVFNDILARVRASQLSTDHSVFLIHGGPGTGKSLIAVNLVAELSAQGYSTFHATGSKAFTTNLRKTVGTRAGEQFKYFNSFMTADESGLDVLVCDEAHRIRDVSWNQWTKKEDRTDRPQIDELIAAAKTSIFFIDDLQVVRPGEVGSSDLIRIRAEARHAPVTEHTLEAQFRCGGSDGYIQWVENTLGLRKTPFVLWDPNEEFDFEIVDSPEELAAITWSRADDGRTARLSAGFCWPWSDPNSDGTLVADVELDGWSMPWNAKEKGKLAKGIPKSNFWASDPGGIDQVGCIYTAQGFEYEYAGVIWGQDLVYRHGTGWTGQPEFSHDSMVKRAAKENLERFADLVKHTYRVLLTRGLLGCSVYFQDDETKQFVMSRVEDT